MAPHAGSLRLYGNQPPLNRHSDITGQFIIHTALEPLTQWASISMVLKYPFDMMKLTMLIPAKPQEYS